MDFEWDRGVQNNIFSVLRQVSEKALRSGREVHLCFIHMEKAFGTIKRQDIWKKLEEIGIELEFIN